MPNLELNLVAMCRDFQSVVGSVINLVSLM